MVDLMMYKRTALWNMEKVPAELLGKHNTKVGTWGKITVVSGQLKFEAISSDNVITGEWLLEPEMDFPMVEPQAWHRVTLMTADTQFFISFYCEPADYFAKKYGMGRTHSEVVAAAMQEDFDMVIGTYDINRANLVNSYDFILSTVVLQFLNPARIPFILENMQTQTNLGGYNLIVAPMDTEDAPKFSSFQFSFKVGELKNYYKDWEMVKYNENFGYLHRLDEQGKPIRLRFATMLARKVN